MSQPATIAWFAAHEFRIASREWIGMLSAGKRGRAGAIAIGLAIFLVFMHAIAYASVREFAKGGLDPDRTTLAIVSSIALLAWCLMISQATESVTRAFYSRSDLELI